MLKRYIDVRGGAAGDPQTLHSALEAMAAEAERVRALSLDLLMLARIDVTACCTFEVLDVNHKLAHLLDARISALPDAVERQFAPPRCARQPTATHSAPSRATFWSMPARRGRCRVSFLDGIAGCRVAAMAQNPLTF